MTLYKRREAFRELSIKIGIAFSRLRLSPNQWTLLSIVPALASVYFLAGSQFLYAALLILLSAFMDMIDGSVARVTGKTSKLGAYLDTLMDRYIEFIVVFGLLLAGLPSFFLGAEAWIFLYLFGSLMTTYSKAAAMEKKLVESELKGGLLERAERMLILFAGIILASFEPLYLTYVIAALAVLTNLSALQRIYSAVSKAKQ